MLLDIIKNGYFRLGFSFVSLGVCSYASYITGGIDGTVWGFLAGLLVTALMELIRSLSIEINESKQRYEELSKSIKNSPEAISQVVMYNRYTGSHLPTNHFENAKAIYKLFKLQNSESEPLVDLANSILMPKEHVKSNPLYRDLVAIYPDSQSALRVWHESFLLVRNSYFGVSFVGEDTKVFREQVEGLGVKRQGEIVARMKSEHPVIKIFIYENESTKARKEVEQWTDEHAKTYGITTRAISLAKILASDSFAITNVWNEYWHHFAKPKESNNMKSIPLCSPDFGIIDDKTMFVYLLDEQRTQIGAAVYLDVSPKVMEQFTQYTEELFKLATAEGYIGNANSNEDCNSNS